MPHSQRENARLFYDETCWIAFNSSKSATNPKGADQLADGFHQAVASRIDALQDVLPEGDRRQVERGGGVLSAEEYARGQSEES